MRNKAERQILKDLCRGRREAYEKVICRHYKDIYRFMVYLTNNTNLAEDLTQETFASAWERAESFKGRASLKTWLHRIAYHKFIDMGRKIHRYDKLIDETGQNNSKETGVFNPLQKIIDKEDSRVLYENIQRLKPAEQVVIILHYIQDMSFRQMAKVLNKSAGTVKWRTSCALKHLRTFLGGKL